MDNHEIYALLKSTEAKKNYIPKPQEIFLKIGDSIIGTAGNFIVYSGLPKTGKSTFINAALASSMTDEYWIFKHQLKKGLEIGYFDTESSESDFYNNRDRIKFMAKKESLADHIRMFATREHDSGINRILIECYLATSGSKIVVIDGLLDIINDFNDIRESKETIQWLKRLTHEYNCLIIGVIHLGKKDNHTLGHFGSMLDRYAQSVLEVKRDFENNIYSLTPKLLRTAKEWFTEICVQWTGENYVEVLPLPAPPQKAKR